MSIRTTYNIDGQLRVINPRSGSSMFVDLSSNQDIYGVKTFINNEQFVDISNTQDIYGVKTFINNEQFVDISYNQDIYGVKTFINNEQFVDISNTQDIYGVKNFISDLLTRNNVNFNTIDGVGRIVFKPNEPAGFGGSLLSVYTTDENDGQGWIFNSDGNLYYQGTGLTPIIIELTPTGNISVIGDISCAGILKSDTIQSYTGGNITINNNIALGSNTISTTGTISSGDITCSGLNASSGIIATSGDIFGNNITGSSLSAGTGTISTTGAISGGAITGTSLSSGGGPINGGIITGTQLSAGSGTISTTGAISGSTISGTTSVSTPSLLTNTISPRTGDILNFASFFSINFLQNATANRIRFFPTRTSGDIFTIFRVVDTTVNNGNWYYNTLGTFGYYASTVDGIKWEILSDGSAKFSGGVLTNTITPYSGTTININPTSNFNFLKAVGSNRILMYPNSTTGDIMRIARTGDTAYGDGYWYWDNTGNQGYISSSITRWEILNNGDITTTTQIKTNTITPNSGTTININPTSNFNWLKSAGVNRILMYPNSISGDVMRIARSGDDDLNFGYWYFNNIGEFGFSFNGATVWRIFVTGNMTTTNTIQAPIFSALTAYTYTNRIQMQNLFYNPSIASIDMRAQYIGFAHPNNALSALAKYAAIVTFVGGDVGFSINNISGYAWGTDWVNRLLYSDYTFQSQKAGFTGGYRYMKFMNSASEIGSISMLSGSMIAFNNTSDYRLKQDIQPLTDSLERLMKLKPKNYRFIADAQDESCCNCYFDGFLAHEVSDIIPMAVTGVKDDPDNFQQLDYSKFTPLLTGAVQELNEKVEKQQILIDNQQILIDKQQILIDSLIKRLDKLEN
jgi:hypothetical protein